MKLPSAFFYMVILTGSTNYNNDNLLLRLNEAVEVALAVEDEGALMLLVPHQLPTLQTPYQLIKSQLSSLFYKTNKLNFLWIA